MFRDAIMKKLGHRSCRASGMRQLTDDELISVSGGLSISEPEPDESWRMRLNPMLPFGEEALLIGVGWPVGGGGYVAPSGSEDVSDNSSENTETDPVPGTEGDGFNELLRGLY